MDNFVYSTTVKSLDIKIIKYLYHENRQKYILDKTHEKALLIDHHDNDPCKYIQFKHTDLYEIDL